MQPNYPPQPNPPAAPTNSAGPLAPTPPPPPPRARRRRPGLFWFALLVSAVVFVGAGTVAVVSYYANPSPTDVVTGYFSALAADNAKGALAYGDVPAGDHRYLTAEVLKQQLAVAALGPAQMLDSTEAADTASVSVHYSLKFSSGSKSVADVVKLVKRSGRWRLANSAIVSNISLAEAGHRMSFAGTTPPDGPTIVFPGALPLHFDTPNLEVESDEAAVSFAQAPDHQLDVELSPAGTQAVQTAVNMAVAACLATTSTDALCPAPAAVSGARVVPGSLHGGDPTGLTMTTHVTTSDDGLISVEGSFDTDGTFTTLDYNNVATPSKGSVSVDFAAQCYITDPNTIMWTVPS